ncbi:uncharacterized protein LOC127749685 [Frankliniella occidentalis]|uniref:Uncharacterized protein LOC127749685 n=1 Tax=Frankliniella occidentalis TaxID=133901 RepID=A0A9C6U412_FRAOC|nr:uncharacterized protein LOC127749685 [Frankliniella occidentalis]
MMILVPVFLALLWCHTCLNVMGALPRGPPCAPPCAPPTREKRHMAASGTRSGTRLVAGHLNNAHNLYLPASSAPLQGGPRRVPVPDGNLDTFRTMALEEDPMPVVPHPGEVVSYFVAEDRGPASTPGASVVLLDQRPAPFATDVHLMASSTAPGAPVTPLLILVPSGPADEPWTASVSPRPPPWTPSVSPGPPPWASAVSPRPPPWTSHVSPSSPPSWTAPWSPSWPAPGSPTTSPSLPAPVGPRPPPAWASPSPSASHRQPQWALPAWPSAGAGHQQQPDSAEAAATIDLMPSGPESNSVVPAARPEATLHSLRSNISALLDSVLYRPPAPSAAQDSAHATPGAAPTAANDANATASEVPEAHAAAEQPSQTSRVCTSAADGSSGVCYSATECRRRGGLSDLSRFQ